eukprot:CFRG8183T1
MDVDLTTKQRTLKNRSASDGSASRRISPNTHTTTSMSLRTLKSIQLTNKSKDMHVVECSTMSVKKSTAVSTCAFDPLRGGLHGNNMHTNHQKQQSSLFHDSAKESSIYASENDVAIDNIDDTKMSRRHSIGTSLGSVSIPTVQPRDPHSLKSSSFIYQPNIPNTTRYNLNPSKPSDLNQHINIASTLASVCENTLEENVPFLAKFDNTNLYPQSFAIGARDGVYGSVDNINNRLHYKNTSNLHTHNHSDNHTNVNASVAIDIRSPHIQLQTQPHISPLPDLNIGDLKSTTGNVFSPMNSSSAPKLHVGFLGSLNAKSNVMSPLLRAHRFKTGNPDGVKADKRIMSNMGDWETTVQLQSSPRPPVVAVAEPGKQQYMEEQDDGLEYNLRALQMGGVYEQFGNFRLKARLGQGQFSEVFEAVNHITQQSVALKKIRLNEVNDVSARGDVIKEISLLRDLKHENIIKYYGTFMIDKALWIVLEFAEAGDLRRMINHFKKKKTNVPEGLLWKYFIQICNGIEYMHSKRVIHRDVKPANVFITKHGNVKLGDLGLGRFMQDNFLASSMGIDIFGTPYYMAPERIDGLEYDLSSDIWSLGCLLYEMAALKSPFYGEKLSLMSLCEKIKMCDYPPLSNVYSKQLRAAADMCMQGKSTLRPTATEVREVAGKMHQIFIDLNAHRERLNQSDADANTKAQTNRCTSNPIRANSCMEIRQDSGASTAECGGKVQMSRDDTGGIHTPTNTKSHAAIHTHTRTQSQHVSINGMNKGLSYTRCSSTGGSGTNTPTHTRATSTSVHAHSPTSRTIGNGCSCLGGCVGGTLKHHRKNSLPATFARKHIQSLHNVTSFSQLQQLQQQQIDKNRRNSKHGSEASTTSEPTPIPVPAPTPTANIHSPAPRTLTINNACAGSRSQRGNRRLYRNMSAPGLHELGINRHGSFPNDSYQSRTITSSPSPSFTHTMDSLAHNSRAGSQTQTQTQTHVQSNNNMQIHKQEQAHARTNKGQHKPYPLHTSLSSQTWTNLTNAPSSLVSNTNNNNNANIQSPTTCMGLNFEMNELDASDLEMKLDEDVDMKNSSPHSEVHHNNTHSCEGEFSHSSLPSSAFNLTFARQALPPIMSFSVDKGLHNNGIGNYSIAGESNSSTFNNNRTASYISSSVPKPSLPFIPTLSTLGSDNDLPDFLADDTGLDAGDSVGVGVDIGGSANMRGITGLGSIDGYRSTENFHFSRTSTPQLSTNTPNPFSQSVTPAPITTATMIDQHSSQHHQNQLQHENQNQQPRTNTQTHRQHGPGVSADSEYGTPEHDAIRIQRLSSSTSITHLTSEMVLADFPLSLPLTQQPSPIFDFHEDDSVKDQQQEEQNRFDGEVDSESDFHLLNLDNFDDFELEAALMANSNVHTK